MTDTTSPLAKGGFFLYRFDVYQLMSSAWNNFLRNIALGSKYLVKHVKTSKLKFLEDSNDIDFQASEWEFEYLYMLIGVRRSEAGSVRQFETGMKFDEPFSAFFEDWARVEAQNAYNASFISYGEFSPPRWWICNRQDPDRIGNVYKNKAFFVPYNIPMTAGPPFFDESP